MKTTKLLKIIAIGAVIAAGFAGCQTAPVISVSYTEPARLNMSGINRIAIDSDNADVESSLSRQIAGTGKYTVAQAEDLRTWKQWKEEREAMEALADYQAQASGISTANLVGAYQENAVRADSSYNRKLLKITGVVKEIGKSSKGRYFARLEGKGSDSVDIYFVSSELSRVAGVNKGQTITVIGTCVGVTLPNMEDTAEILRILGGGRPINIIDATFPVEGFKDYSGAVDAVISASTTISIQDGSRTEKRMEARRTSDGKVVKDEKGNTVYNERDVTIYERSATVNIAYQVIRAQDRSLIGEGTKSAASPKASNEDRSRLPTAADLVARIIPVGQLVSEIIPTKRSVGITLAEEKDNKEAKKEMGEAQKLVKEQKYADAAAVYGRIYTAHKNFAAGYNQAVLTEATAGTEAAIKLMEALVKETGNPTAQNALKGMQSRITANQQAEAQLAQ
jgi:hypothetical protein